MTKRFRIGQTVKLTEDAAENENYAQYVGKPLTISDISTAYMPAEEFYKQGAPAGFHPGFDGSTNCALYDFQGCPFSLYDWEIEPA